MIKGKSFVKAFIVSIMIPGIAPVFLMAAGLDCSKVQNRTEATICKDSSLPLLDLFVSDVYDRHLETTNAEAVKKDQRTWLQQVLYACRENKECIKKAYEDRLDYLKKTRKPYRCPQCGIWQSSDEANLFLIEDKRIIIPGCGNFTYKTKTTTSTREGEDRYVYKVSMVLKQATPSFLCPEREGTDGAWYLDATIDGHFREASVGNFELRRKRTDKDPVLVLSGWNQNREDPCGAGSGYGSAACIAMERSLVYAGLSRKLEQIYHLILDSKVNKLPNFNTARFSAVVGVFCDKQNRNNGGGHWPQVHSLSCQWSILTKKYQEFVAWEKCTERKKKISRCNFPDESFDKTESTECQEP